MKFSVISIEQKLKDVPDNIDVRLTVRYDYTVYSGLDINIIKLIEQNNLSDVNKKTIDIDFISKMKLKFEKEKYTGLWNKKSENEFKFNTIINGVKDGTKYPFPGVKFVYTPIEDQKTELEIYVNNKALVKVIKGLV